MVFLNSKTVKSLFEIPSQHPYFLHSLFAFLFCLTSFIDSPYQTKILIYIFCAFQIEKFESKQKWGICFCWSLKEMWGERKCFNPSGSQSIQKDFFLKMLETEMKKERAPHSHFFSFLVQWKLPWPSLTYQSQWTESFSLLLPSLCLSF